MPSSTCSMARRAWSGSRSSSRPVSPPAGSPSRNWPASWPRSTAAALSLATDRGRGRSSSSAAVSGSGGSGWDGLPTSCRCASGGSTPTGSSIGLTPRSAGCSPSPRRPVRPCSSPVPSCWCLSTSMSSGRNCRSSNSFSPPATGSGWPWLSGSRRFSTSLGTVCRASISVGNATRWG